MQAVNQERLSYVGRELFLVIFPLSLSPPPSSSSTFGGLGANGSRHLGSGNQQQFMAVGAVQMMDDGRVQVLGLGT